jgi:hypothetical protein
VYKISYAAAAWLWKRGVTRIEVHNEPDLSGNNACLNPAIVGGAYADRYWVDYYTLRSRGVQEAYADLNADAASGAVACPALAGVSCPITPRLMASAFAGGSVSLAQGAFSGLSVANEHSLFGTGNVTTGYSNMQALSFHSYGKSGSQLSQQAAAMAAVLATPGPMQHTPVSTPLPVVITEHASLTSGNWQQQGDNSDYQYHAARLAAQLLYCASSGFETYVFKFSMQPSGSMPRAATQVVKSGLHFGDNSVAPYSIGDTTWSGKAMSLITPYTTGAKPLLSCAGFSSAYQSCVVVQDGGKYHIFLVNDFDRVGQPTGVNPDKQVTLSLAPLGISPASQVIISEVSAGFYGEVSKIASVASLGAGQSLSYLLQAYGTARITVPVAPQSVKALAPSADATLFAGNNAFSNFGTLTTLKVSTSSSAVHDGTAIALVQFNLAAGYSVANVAILELTVQNAPQASTVYHIIGINPSSPPVWAESNISWVTATWAVSQPTTLITSISQNFMKLGPGAGNGNVIAGHMTVAATDAGVTKRVDVTRFVTAAANGGSCSVTFMIARRFRRNLQSPASPFNDTIPSDDFSTGNVVFAGREAGVGAPALRVISDVTAPAYVCNPAASANYTVSTTLSVSSVALSTFNLSQVTQTIATAVNVPDAAAVVNVVDHSVAITLSLSGTTTPSIAAVSAAVRTVLAGLGSAAAGITVTANALNSAASVSPSGRRLLQNAYTLDASGFGNDTSFADQVSSLLQTPAALDSIAADTTTDAADLLHTPDISAQLSVDVFAAYHGTTADTIAQSLHSAPVLNQGLDSTPMGDRSDLVLRDDPPTITSGWNGPGDQPEGGPRSPYYGELSPAQEEAMVEHSELFREWFGVGIAFVIAFGVALVAALIAIVVLVRKLRAARAAAASAAAPLGGSPAKPQSPARAEQLKQVATTCEDPAAESV